MYIFIFSIYSSFIPFLWCFRRLSVACYATRCILNMFMYIYIDFVAAILDTRNTQTGRSQLLGLIRFVFHFLRFNNIVLSFRDFSLYFTFYTLRKNLHSNLHINIALFVTFVVCVVFLHSWDIDIQITVSYFICFHVNPFAEHVLCVVCL